MPKVLFHTDFTIDSRLNRLHFTAKDTSNAKKRKSAANEKPKSDKLETDATDSDDDDDEFEPESEASEKSSHDENMISESESESFVTCISFSIHVDFIVDSSSIHVCDSERREEGHIAQTEATPHALVYVSQTTLEIEQCEHTAEEREAQICRDDSRIRRGSGVQRSDSRKRQRRAKSV